MTDSVAQGGWAMPLSRCGRTASNAVTVPIAIPNSSRKPFSASTSPEIDERLKPTACSNASFAAPLQHAADHHHRQAERPEQQPEPAERLEGIEVGVLDNQISGQAVGRTGGVEALVGELLLELRAGAGLGGLDQKEVVAAAVGKQFEEVLLGHDELRLKKAARHQPGDDQLARASAAVGPIEFLAEAEMQYPLDGVGVAEDRDGVAGEVAVEDEPGVGPLFGGLG